MTSEEYVEVSLEDVEAVLRKAAKADLARRKSADEKIDVIVDVIINEQMHMVEEQRSLTALAELVADRIEELQKDVKELKGKGRNNDS